ncbi:MAG: hypothetical protein IKT42_06890 [Clostridia bacterium]|nr:hypothetical protein [Clostridia bacterium]
MDCNKMKYTLVLTKEDANFDGWRTNLSEVVTLVDVIWSDVCTLEESRKQFEDLVMKQSHEFHQLKTISKWRTVRLYDADGRQIAQES